MAHKSRYLIHLMSGGLGHALHYFGNSVAYAAHTGRRVIPCFEAYETFRTPFHEVFSVDTSVVCTDREASDALDAFSRSVGFPGEITLSNLVRIHGSRNESVPAFGKAEIAYSRSTYLPNIAHPWARFLIVDGQLRSGVGTSGKVASAWFNARVGMFTGLRRGMAVLGVQPQVLERTKALEGDGPRGYVGVHFRNTDRRSDFDEFIGAARLLCAEYSQRHVYWATDDSASLIAAAEALGPIEVHSFARLPKMSLEGVGNLHCAPAELLEAAGITKKDQVFDSLGDIYMLTRASAFRGNDESALSRMVSFMRKDRDLARTFLGIEPE